MSAIEFILGAACFIAAGYIIGYIVGKRVQLESDATLIHDKFQKFINELRISQLPDTDYCKGLRGAAETILAEFGLERDKEPIC